MKAKNKMVNTGRLRDFLMQSFFFRGVLGWSLALFELSRRLFVMDALPGSHDPGPDLRSSVRQAEDVDLASRPKQRRSLFQTCQE